MCVFVCSALISRRGRRRSAPACACTKSASRTAHASTHAIGSVHKGNICNVGGYHHPWQCLHSLLIISTPELIGLLYSVITVDVIIDLVGY